ncbi:MAG: transposase [Flavobacterium sp.]|nr:MAG: transposase [Flavobacterium sp.]
MSKFKKLLDDLNINETFNKKVNRPKVFNAVKDNIPLVEDWNMMADLFFLPTAKFGFKYLFVIVDLATDEFDIEPIKDKRPSTVLKAMEKCFARDFVKEPKYSLKTDGGLEFKGVFHKWLYDESILHKTALPHRHNSMANVESLNGQLARLFNGYMNQMEEQTGKRYNNWTDVVDQVREGLNAIRKKKVPKDINSYEYPVPEDTREVLVSKKIKKKTVKVKRYELINPKFQVGQYVYRYLDHPKNALGVNQPTAQRRMGDYLWDRVPRRIKQVFTMGGVGPLYRYYLVGIPNVSYTEQQLKLAPNPNNEN